MKYLLDTCLISELIKRQPDQRTLKWVRAVDEAQCFISVITVGEIQKGITKLTDNNKQDRLRAWFDNDFSKRFRNRIIPINNQIASKWGEILGTNEQKGVTLPVIDALIAATAITMDLTVVTRNTKDIQRCGAKILNPWQTK